MAEVDLRPKRNPEIETKLLPDGHAVLYSTQSCWAHTITPLAAVAWEFCDGDHSEEDISARVAEIAQVAADPEFENSVKELIREFKESGLVVV